MSGGTVRWLDAHLRHPAVVDFAHCVRAWGGLVARGQLRSPKEYVGTHLHFRDGTTSLVFRETLRRAPTLEPALLVIQFRLAALGSNRWAHAAFRRECVLHTPLFAGFPGFRSKLWADDVTTGIYRGVYEWDGAEAARAYATRMVGLLAPFSSADTACRSRRTAPQGSLRAAFAGTGLFIPLRSRSTRDCARAASTPACCST